jgi:hypothetical protein
VYRLLNCLSFAADQLAVFQGASEVPISVSYGRLVRPAGLTNNSRTSLSSAGILPFKILS